MSTEPTVNAIENMPACSTPENHVATIVNIGNRKPHVAMPIVFQT